MLNNGKWWLTSLFIVLTLVLVTGCGGNDAENEDTANQDTEEAENQEGGETPEGTDEGQQEGENTDEGQAGNIPAPDKDADLETQIKEDEGVEDVMVQVIEGDDPAVNVDLIINDQQALSPEDLIEKYSEAIREKYPDRRMDIMVVKDGQVVGQKTFE